MKRLLRTSVAVAALLTAAAFANAQTRSESSDKGAQIKQQNESARPAPSGQEQSEGRSVAPNQAGQAEGKAMPDQTRPAQHPQQTEGKRPSAAQQAEPAQPKTRQNNAEGKPAGEAASPSTKPAPPPAKPTGQGQAPEEKAPGAQSGGAATSPQGRAETPSTAGSAAKAPAQKQQGEAAQQGGGAPTTLEGRSAFGLSKEQQTQVRDILENDRLARVSHADFNVAVGAVAPRTVHFAPVPRSVARVAPRYRGLEFFMVRDEIAIVNPRTRRIVAIIPESGRPCS